MNNIKLRVMVSAFRGIIEFFDQIGLYDVVLPFLLVFAIVFAILEKTKVFGQEDVDGKKYTRKNINAIVAFVIAFLVVASSQLVDILTTVSSYAVILLMVSVLFLLLIGSFMKEEKVGVFLRGGWSTFFIFIMFIGIALIFLSAIKTDNGSTWLETSWGWLSGSNTSAAVGSIILLIIIILFMVYIVKEPKKESSNEPKTD